LEAANVFNNEFSFDAANAPIPKRNFETGVQFELIPSDHKPKSAPVQVL
jgi:hypothetical protein